MSAVARFSLEVTFPMEAQEGTMQQNPNQERRPMTTQQIPIYEGLLAETSSFLGDGGVLLRAYLARPLGAGPYPGVIVIHEAFGLVEHTKEIVRRFATREYIALAPDLYTRSGAPDPSDLAAIMEKMGDLTDVQVVNDLEEAARHLKGLPQCSGKVGAIGYCSGGRHTLLFACNTSSISAAVDCYGGRVIPDELTKAQPVAVIDMIEHLRCPLLGLFGEADQNPSPAHVARLEEELKKYAKIFEFNTYPADVGHGFFAAYRPSYRQEAAVDGWMRVFAWFEKYLKS
jgi:carboxymethylenebutenolidase